MTPYRVAEISTLQKQGLIQTETRQKSDFFISNFRRVLNVVCFLSAILRTSPHTGIGVTRRCYFCDNFDLANAGETRNTVQPFSAPFHSSYLI